MHNSKHVLPWWPWNIQYEADASNFTRIFSSVGAVTFLAALVHPSLAFVQFLFNHIDSSHVHGFIVVDANV